MGHTRENSKSVREGKLQSIVWINTVTYAGGKTQLRIQKELDRFGGKSQAQLCWELKKSIENRVQKGWQEIRWGKFCNIDNLLPVTEICAYLFESMNMG